MREDDPNEEQARGVGSQRERQTWGQGTLSEGPETIIRPLDTCFPSRSQCVQASAPRTTHSY